MSTAVWPETKKEEALCSPKSRVRFTIETRILRDALIDVLTVSVHGAASYLANWHVQRIKGSQRVN